MDKKQLEARLVHWAEEYGGSRYEDIGFASRNILQSLIEHQGFMPSWCSRAPTPMRARWRDRLISSGVKRLLAERGS